MSAPQRSTDRDRHREQSSWATRAPGRSLTPLALGVALVALLLHFLQHILLPFVVAGVTAYVLAPAVGWLTLRTRLPRWSVALGLLAVLMGIVALTARLGLPLLLRQAQEVTADLHGAVAGFLRALLGTHSVQVLGSTLDAQGLTDVIVGTLQHEITGARLVHIAGVGAAVAFGFILVWVLIGYFLLDSPAIAAGLLWLVPPRNRAWTERIWHEFDPILRRYFVGVAAVVAYASVAAYLGLGLLLGLHHAFVLALLTGMLELLPMVGPAAAAVMAGLVAVQQAASAWDIWAYVGYAIALRLSIDQLVGPLVLGKAASVHPVVVMFCFLAGAALFGITGVILAVPVAILVKVSLSVLYQESGAQ